MIRFGKRFSVVLLLAVVPYLSGGFDSVGLGTQTQAEVDLEEGLVAYWPFDEGEGDIAFDASGNYNHTSVLCTSDDCSPPTWVEGKIGTALAFDGVDDYALLSSKVATWGLDATISAWVKTTMASSHPFRIYPIIGRWVSSGRHTSSQAFGVINGKIAFQISQNVKYVGCEYKLLGIQGSTVNDGNWHHVAALIDQSSDTVMIYLDGKRDTKGDISEMADGGCRIPGMFYLGSTGNSPNLYFSGAIDEVHIYDRSLSEKELKRLYESEEEF